MWQDLVDWFQSPGGARVLQTAIIPALAILVAAVVAALIARSAVKATIRRSDRIEASCTVGALVAAARLATGPDDEHAARLRSEADVRTRLLPLPGAGLAADWAAARIDGLQHRSAAESVTSGLDELRDRLVAWVEHPARAKRLFATPAAPQIPAATPSTSEAAELGVAEVEAVEAPAQERPTRPEPGPGPRRTPAPEAPAAVEASTPEPGSEAASPAAGPGEAVPAWQRTRAGERLQQERFKTRAVEPPPVDEDDLVPVSTAPVQLSHAHRAQGAPSADADEAVRLEAHQQARHARPGEQPQAANGAAPAAPVTPAPAWLDTYDDEAQVTQNLDLKTPPPVAAAAIRDRGAPGDDLVPRS